MRKRSNGVAMPIVFGIGFGLILAVAFAAGFLVNDWLETPSSADYPLLAEVQGLLDQRYLRPQPDTVQRQYAAVRGMLGSLNDPFTFFIDPPVAASESDVLAGVYGGIGVQIQRSEAGELVLYPFTESPAEVAGILPGDMLRAIDGVPVDLTLAADALDQRLRGEVREGSGVALGIERADAETLTVFVPFGLINVPSVVWRVLPEDTRFGYVQILRFTGRTPDELTTAMTDLRAAGITGLVVDLRDNTGGLLTESIEVADAFIDDGVIVFEKSIRGEQAFRANPDGAAADLPLVVLVDDYTASGAELVAGAIQDSGRGILIGQRTYGKGTVQEIHGLSDGSSLHVTSSEWFTPAHQALDQNGLQPNIEMIPDASGRDVELGEALRQLQAQVAVTT